MSRIPASPNLLPPVESVEWRTWSPRAELAPRFERVGTPDGAYLRTDADGRAHAYGSWQCETANVCGGLAYRLEVEYRTDNVAFDSVYVSMIVTWMDDQGSWLHRSYIDEDSEAANGWRRLGRTIVTLEGTKRARIELEFRWSVGAVEWRSPLLAEVGRPAPRQVKLATTYYMPKRNSPDAFDMNVREIVRRIEEAGRQCADLVCISEAMCSRCASLEDLFADPPQTIPGSLTDIICAKAREFGCYIVFNLDEHDGGLVYNTSVLIDRSGAIVGKYRKVHLPLAEAQLGFTPGSEYPVFDTDFGRIGILICWDQMFPEAARLMRLQRAEVICIPTAGDAPIQTAARAVDNGVYVIVAGTNGEKPSRIINPAGEVMLAFGEEDETGVRCVTVDLNRKFYKYWESVGPAYGETQSLYVKERRPDTYGLLSSPSHMK